MANKGAHKSKGPFGKEDTDIRHFENVRRRRVINQLVRDITRSANIEGIGDEVDVVLPIFLSTTGYLTW